MRNETVGRDGLAATSDAPPVYRDPTGAALVRRLGGVARTTDELAAYLDSATRAFAQEVTACDEVAITLLDDTLRAGPSATADLPSREQGRDAYGSVLAVPLVSAGEQLGTLSLYAVRTEAFDELDEAVVRLAGQCCADRVAAAQEIIRARTHVAQLEDAMASRAVIEQAKGILIGLRGTNAHDAFEILRKESQDRNIRVRDLAEHIVTTAQGAPATGRGRG